MHEVMIICMHASTIGIPSGWSPWVTHPQSGAPGNGVPGTAVSPTLRNLVVTPASITIQIHLIHMVPPIRGVRLKF